MVASAGAKTKGGPIGVSVALGFDSYLVKVQSYGGGYVSLENMIMSFW